MADDAPPPTSVARPVMLERLVAFILVIYLLVTGLGAATCLIQTFPAKTAAAPMAVCSIGSFVITWSSGDILLVVAFLAGVVGSFLHAAQSLATYVGNDDFKMSLATWFFLRPWIGGILGFALYFVARAGLVGGAAAGSTDNVNAYGIVAVGMLGGWFSKTATDKLQEVFSTLFKTDADKERKNKLTAEGQPSVTAVSPAPVPLAATEIVVTGTGFATADVSVTVGPVSLDVSKASEKSLTVSLAKLTPRPTGEAVLVVRNPTGTKPAAEPFKITFEG